MISKLKAILTPILIVLLVVTAARGAMWEWSKVAATNSTADPTINWSEGQSPSSVNDSARAMMARMAEYRDDISGALTTGGTSTAFTLTTNQGLATVPTTGQLIAFTPHATNGISPTLTTDGGTTYAIQQASGTAVGAGTLVQGTPYTAMFNGTAWVLRNFYGNPYAIPLGGLMAYTGTTAPNSNFVLPAGQCVSRTTYATYFAQVSTTYGACDGVTTFGVPDLRGRVIAAIDNLNGSAASRLTTTYFGTDPTVQGNVGGAQNTTLVTGNLPAYTPSGTVGTVLNSGTTVYGGTTINNHNPEGVLSGPYTAVALSAASTFTGTAQGGTSTPVSRVMPAMVLTYILRII